MKRVPVVDDEPFVRQVIADILEDEGYDTLFASSGRSMLKLLETERPDLVILDVMMPDGNGREALRAVQSQADLRDIPVVMMGSGLASRRPAQGAVGFLVKPFDLDQLLHVVIGTIGPASEPGRS